MKYTPTITLALALTAGMASAAAAQTMASPTIPTNDQNAAPAMAPATTTPTVRSEWIPGQSRPSFVTVPAGASPTPAAAAPQMQSTWVPGQSRPSFVQPGAEVAPYPVAGNPNPQSQWVPGRSHPSYTQPQSNASQLPAANATAQTPGYGGQPMYGQPMYREPTSAQTQPMPAPNGPMQNAGNERVRAAQQQLQAAGLYSGPADGVMDPDTRAGIARFQQQNGLRRTSNLDDRTFERLTAGGTAGVGSSMPNAEQGPGQAPVGAGANGANGSHD